jgi:iron complex outermembrane receptor protein
MNKTTTRGRDCRSRRYPTLVLAAVATLYGAAAHAAVTLEELVDLTLEQLAEIQVTSVSRREESLADAPASIYVITQDSIRRSGATSLPEALRLAPNLQVARTTATGWAISARGFNNAIGNKLLVLVDGRTVYTPLFSGVFWDQQDVMLEDVERIEVISGPGATAWGANAVNGVINVITRAARDTQGVLATVGGGNTEQRGALRYGGRLGDVGHYRVYGKRDELENTTRLAGDSALDGWHAGQAGFRADWSLGRDTYTVQGDAYRSRGEHGGFAAGFELGPVRVSGINALARWTRRLDDDSNMRLQAYIDRTKRDDPLFYKPESQILDVDFQHALRRSGHHVVWGAGYRRGHDNVRPGEFFTAFVPASRTLTWSNVFVQDEIAINDRVSLTPGLRAEYNTYTAMEYLPSLRLAWKPAGGRLVWGAVSRAVRSPSRLDRDVRFPSNPPFLVQGGPNFQSEVANVFELGYRATLASALTYSVTAFRHNWKRLRTGEGFPVILENRMSGFVNGVEAWATWQASRAWRLSGGFTVLREHLGLEPGSTDALGAANPQLANDASHQWQLRSSHDVAPGHELDVMLRRVGALPLQDVPAYTALDARWGWHLTKRVELSLTGNNLLDHSHAEFGPVVSRGYFGRSAFLKILWRTQ